MKATTWLGLLVPLAFFPLRSPYTLIALPIMVERMLSGRVFVWWSTFHYDAPVWILMALAAVDGFSRLPRSWRRHLRGLRGPSAVLAGYLVIANIIGTVDRWLPYLPDGVARDAAVAVIPANTCVVADNHAAIYLTHTNRVTVPGASQHRQDFYIIDYSEPQTSPPPFAWTPAQTEDYARSLGFQEIFRIGNMVVLQAPDYAGPDPHSCGPGAR